MKNSVSWQQTIVIGHLGRDPELRFPGNGTIVCNFNVAVNERWRDRHTDKPEERTTWYRVESWGNRAEFCSKILRKGYQVLVVGTAYASVFTKRDGQSAVSLNLRAHIVSLLNPSKGPKVIHGTESSLESITDFTPHGADLQSQDDKDLDGEDEKISLVDGQDGAELYEYILDYHGLSEPLSDHPFDEDEYFDVWDEIPGMDDYVWVNNVGWDS